jgi:DNA-directed RNA polymerase III subunit RPC8
MFFLLRLRDTIEIEPAYFSPEKLQQPPVSSPLVTTTSSGDAAPAADSGNRRYAPSHEDILWHRVSERYVGKVIPSRGLCIAIAELVQFSNSTIRGSDGSSWTSVTFDAVVLRPEVGERIRANIHRQTEKGIYLSVELFHDIFVPASHLVHPSIYDESTGTWHLKIEDEDAGNGAVTLNPYRKDDDVIVMVRDVVVRSSVDLLSADESSLGPGMLDDDSPMVVIGSFLDVGLGPCVWFE